MIDNQIPWIELDVYLSKDHIPMVLHGDNDGNLEQECPERGVYIGMRACDANCDDLKQLDIGDGEKIPTLEETF